MKLLLDTCISSHANKTLKNLGYDVEWVAKWASDPGDSEILRKAHGNQRILVTLDKDFGELAIVHNVPHSGIIRLVNFSSREQANACDFVLKHYAGDLVKGAILTVEEGKVRVRLPRVT